LGFESSDSDFRGSVSGAVGLLILAAALKKEFFPWCPESFALKGFVINLSLSIVIAVFGLRYSSKVSSSTRIHYQVS